jgi:hypothetical protein
MRQLFLILIFTLIFCLNGFSQKQIQVEYRVEKQAMSTPMTDLEEVFFMNYYHSKPMNVKFDGSVLNMYYDNGMTFTKREVAEVKKEAEFEDNQLIMEIFRYVDKKNLSDTISLVFDHEVGYVQVILPTKNSKGEYVGYTSYKQFIDKENLALK